MINLFSTKQILVIDIAGTISTRSQFRNGYNHYEVISQLTKAAEDKNIAAVLLRVNSHGGTAGASWELYSTVRSVSLKKSVYTSISDVCCSGAYLAIAASSRIYSSLMANVGSIGVFMQVPVIEDLADRIGIKMHTVKSSDFKDIGNPFRDITPEERRYIQETVDTDYIAFREIVLRHRQQITNPDYVCDGKFFTGRDAKDLGLVDVIGTFSDALSTLKKVTGTEKVSYVSQPKGISKLLSKLSGGLQVNLNIPDLFKG